MITHNAPTRRPTPPARQGFTVAELLVSSAVLVIMVLIVGQIVTSSQKLATTAQTKMRTNAAAEALAGTIRADVSGASKNGFLCIGEHDGQPFVMLTPTGPIQSLTAQTSGTDAVVTYGLADNQADAGSTTNDILFRVGYVLSADADAGDRRRHTLAFVRGHDRTQLSEHYITGTILGNLGVDDLEVPTVQLSRIDQFWKVLAPHASRLALSWTDGTTDPTHGTLVWYGHVWNPDAADGVDLVAKDNGWSGRDAGNGAIEFQDTDGGYRALWTHHDQSNWPKAIKISFDLRDPAMPAEFHNTRYELICPMGR